MTEEIKQIKKANKAAVVERWMMMYSDSQEDYEGITAMSPSGQAGRLRHPYQVSGAHAYT